MVARFSPRGALAATATVAAALSLASTADADPSVVVYPGMEIRQDTNVCTLGFVDPTQRIAFSAGHCRGNGPVTDKAGRYIGTVSTSRDNTPNGTVVRTDQVISDYETITLATDVQINPVLPGGRLLVADPAAPLAAGQPVDTDSEVLGLLIENSAKASLIDRCVDAVGKTSRESPPVGRNQWMSTTSRP